MYGKIIPAVYSYILWLCFNPSSTGTKDNVFNVECFDLLEIGLYLNVY